MKIQFIYSPQFNRALSKAEVTFPVAEIDALNTFWKEEGEKIELSLFKITDLVFQEDVKCYLNTQFSVSDPLCLKIEDIERMKICLVHELIHVLLTQNKVGITKKWKDIMEKYKDEFPVTRVHVVIHKIHLELAKRIFPNQIDDIVYYSEKVAYRKSWTFALNDEVDVKFAV